MIANYSKEMRKVYYRMNNISHIEIWETPTGYAPALCDAPEGGFPQEEHPTISDAQKWAETYCPELHVYILEEHT